MRHALGCAACLTLGSLTHTAAIAASFDVTARPLISQPLDEHTLVQVAGNRRPEATSLNDRGKVADTLVLEHMQLLLRRSPEREQAPRAPR
jgi:hypothetical protein